MSVSLKQIEDQARALSAEERASLAESMLESLHPRLSEIESAWAEEIERRGAAFDRGGDSRLSRRRCVCRSPSNGELFILTHSGLAGSAERVYS